MKRWIVCVALISPVPLASGLRADRWVVWNVGQGSWMTAKVASECLHFDAGGERWPVKPLRRLCKGVDHRVLLSHSDWDHVAGLGWLARQARVCLETAPLETVRSPWKLRLWRGLPSCNGVSAEELRWRRIGTDPNDASRVFVFKNRILLPGDSTSRQERRWAFSSRSLARVRILILGHHGSKTSTSATLLSQLPKVRIAIASARKKKYGHPHPTVIRRLRKLRIGILRTEEWGHLIFEL